MNWLVTKFMKNFFWSKGMNIGVNSIVKRGVFFQIDEMKIGNHVYIGPGSYIHAGGGVVIGDGTIIGPKVKIWSVNHEYDSFNILPYTPSVLKQSVLIGKGCWIGLDVRICPNVTIGNGVVVAMGSVVTKDIPSFSIVGGNPAKIIKMRYKTEDEKENLELLIAEDAFYGKEYFKR